MPQAASASYVGSYFSSYNGLTFNYWASPGENNNVNIETNFISGPQAQTIIHVTDPGGAPITVLDCAPLLSAPLLTSAVCSSWLYDLNGQPTLDRGSDAYKNAYITLSDGSEHLTMRGDAINCAVNRGCSYPVIVAGNGTDVIDVRDGHPEWVYCGTGNDTVLADASDLVDASCKNVHIG